SETPPTGTISIGPLVNFGSGCPQGTVSAILSSDELVLTYDSLTAAIGPGIPIGESRKNCQLATQFTVPAGWQFSFDSINYRGYLQVDENVTAQLRGEYRFQGSSVASTITSLSQMDNGSYSIIDEFTNVVWSQCNHRSFLYINSLIRLNGPAGQSGIITVDPANQQVTQIYGIKWKRC
ncbi:hypothetical protein HDU92_000989, partial [Lobulomyces angularis]